MAIYLVVPKSRYTDFLGRPGILPCSSCIPALLILTLLSIDWLSNSFTGNHRHSSKLVTSFAACSAFVTIFLTRCKCWLGLQVVTWWPSRSEDAADCPSSWWPWPLAFRPLSGVTVTRRPSSSELAMSFHSQLRVMHGTDRQTDRQTYRRRPSMNYAPPYGVGT